MSSILPVVETFHSLQGEGVHTGRSAFFIRLGSCKVGCSWCDTKHSWAEELHPKITIEKLAEATSSAISKGAAFVVLTGGEPLHHNLDELCNMIRTKTLKSNGIPSQIHLETSGVNELSGPPDWITLSPKRHAPPRAELLTQCQELKVIINEKEDIGFAESMAKKARSRNSTLSNSISHYEHDSWPLLFLQPGWNNSQGKRLAYNYVLDHPEWRLSMQTHKWLKVS